MLYPKCMTSGWIMINLMCSPFLSLTDTQHVPIHQCIPTRFRQTLGQTADPRHSGDFTPHSSALLNAHPALLSLYPHPLPFISVALVATFTFPGMHLRLLFRATLPPPASTLDPLSRGPACPRCP